MWLAAWLGVSQDRCRPVVGGKSQILIGRGRLPNGACQHQCPRCRISSPKLLLPMSVSPGEVPVASWLPGQFSNISKWVWPGLPFKSLPLLGLRVCEILCALFKSGIFVSYSPSQSPVARRPCWPSKPDILQAHLLSVQDPHPTPRWELQIPCSLGISSAAVTILPSIGCLPTGCRSLLHLCLSLPTSLWSLLYIYSLETFFSLISGHSHMIVAL